MDVRGVVVAAVVAFPILASGATTYERPAQPAATVSARVGAQIRENVPRQVSGAATQLIQNGSFEINGGPNSAFFANWSIVDESGGSGTWLVQTGSTGPVNEELFCGQGSVAPPPNGSFAAMSTQSGPGSHILYQDVTIPPGAQATLSFQYYIRNTAQTFHAPASLSYQTTPNQHFRVDVVDPGFDPFTLTVLRNVVIVGEGSPAEFGYVNASDDLSAFAGRTVRIRFAEVDNQGCFNAGVDNVSVSVESATPAPSIDFTSNPQTIPFGGSSTLTWMTRDATSVEIDNGIGLVSTSGSRTVSPQQTTTFTLTARGPGGASQRQTTLTVLPAGPSIEFSAVPSTIEQGQTSTLTWRTSNATSVTIDNGVGSQPTSGSVTVRPSVTTAYTLTAAGPGGSATARATVFVEPGAVPIVSATAFPGGLIQAEGLGGAGDQFALTNLGRAPTTITLGQSGNFFTQTPSTFTLPAGATQIVAINATPQPAGTFEGTSIPMGAGVPPGLTIPVRLLVTAPPVGNLDPSPTNTRPEVTAPAEVNPTGSVSFTNSGSGTLQGLAVSDAAWLIPQRDVVTIGPGQTTSVSFTADRSLRPDAASLAGAATAKLSLVYLDSNSSSSGFSASGAGTGSGNRGAISVSIVDVVKPGVTPGAPPPLAAGELAVFAPGLVQRNTASGDLLLSVVGNAVSDLKLYFGGPGATPLIGSLDQIAPNSGLSLPSVMRNVFATNAPRGTVQMRSTEVSRVAVASIQTSTVNRAGSFITALPTFRSDRSTAAGGTIHLPGVEKTGRTSTDLFVQETAGVAADATIDFLDASGNVAGSLANQSIGAFTMLSIPDAVPANAASVRITNMSPGGGRLVAYAMVTDAATQDGWVIADSALFGGESAIHIVPILPSTADRTPSRTRLFVFNPGGTPLQLSVEGRASSGVRRRPVRTSSSSSSPLRSNIVSSLSVGPQQTMEIPAGDLTSGYLRVSGSHPFALSARSVIEGAGSIAFGTTLPSLQAAAGLASGQSRRFSSVDDASQRTVSKGTPVTYRSNLGLIESTGQPVVVRLTLRYVFSAGTRTSAQGVNSIDVPIPANQLVLVNDLSRAVIGGPREGYGDLRNMQLDVEVVGGSGQVIPFLQTIDNGSDDSTIRME